MFESNVKRLMAAYPTIYLACHREHVHADEQGNPITEHQASVLDHLDATRPTTPSRLAEHMGVSRSTMSTTVSRLLHAGLVVRKPARNDRRSVELTLTPAGKRVQDQNTVLNPTLVRQIFTLMPAQEADSALAGIECLAKYAAILLKRRKRERD
jgi:MarR family transcriptional regulator, organic hydroperoxide resistance regulator